MDKDMKKLVPKEFRTEECLKNLYQSPDANEIFKENELDKFNDKIDEN